MKNKNFEKIILNMMNTEKFYIAKEDCVSDDEIITEIKKIDSLEYIDRDGRTLLINAAFYGRERVIEYLIKQGADIHAIDKEGLSALHAAVMSGDKQCVKLLLEAGMDPNHKNCFGNNTLLVYKLNTDRDILKLLMQYGANPKLKNNYGVSAEDCYVAYEDIMENLK